MRTIGRASRAITVAAILQLSLATVSPAFAVCTGDCDDGGSVSIAELIRAVSVALGRAALGTCSAADRNGDGTVAINELIASVNAALFGCAPVSPTATVPDTATATPSATFGEVTPTASATAGNATPTPTATIAVPLGIFIHPDSVFQHVLTTSDFISVSIMVAVDKAAEETVQVSLSGPGGTVNIPFSSKPVIDGQSYASFFAANPSPGLSYTAGAIYTLRVETSIGSATLELTTPGGISITGDGTQVSWEHDGDRERILVYSGSSVGYDSGLADRSSPFAIPVAAYGSGPGTYRVSGEVRRAFAPISGAAAGSGFLVTDSRFSDVVPAMVGNTHTPTRTPTSTPTRTHTPTSTATPTITGTIPPTPPLEGEILFDSTREGGRHIFVMDADGGNVVQLTFDAGSDLDPQWSPDKSRIAFTRDGRLHLMNADGGDVTPLRAAPFQFFPTFSPDGATIVFAEQIAFSTNLFAYDLASEQVTPLTSGSWNDANPTFSPDGAFIYFTSTRDSDFFEIYRMKADGSEVTRLTENANYEQLGEVSPDGTMLAFSARAAVRTRTLAVWVMDLGTMDAVQLTSTQDDSDDERPLWSPDGNYIAYRPFLSGHAQVFRMQANGLFMTDLSPDDASEVANDWK